MLIELEKTKSRPNIEGLYRLKHDYQANVDRLTKAIASRSVPEVTVDDVHRLQKELLQMSKTGDSFRQIHQAKEEMQRNFCKKDKNVFSIAKMDSSIVRLIHKHFNT